MKLKIVDYSVDIALAEAITRYYTLLQMSFAAGGLYKLFETADTQIQRFIQGPGLGNTPSQTPNSGIINGYK